MRTIIGVVVCVSSVIIGLYLGIWVMLIGGIVQIVQSVTPTVEALGIAIGIVRVLLTSVVSWVSFYFLLGLGLSILK